ncbi:MAG: hypothetical protein SPK50_08040 [Mobiluncus porci]|uniref:hypothetical protein n=1 Tax=Mobiluncus porci TaxID=2652278 RepID=UPI0023F3AF7A|nr:hypothetical protein [Mobiluncus porci]MDD7542263.1 hypothetical protein [Mobiluncus porci]MDY5749062.1 hypothetical protein [Mobiluncus porci]
MKTKHVLASVAGAALLGTAMIIPANADTFQNYGPETVINNANLPLINTYRSASYLKPNVLNAYPVCNAGEDLRTVVYKVTTEFEPKGTISSTNRTAEAIPLTQTLSKTESISFTYKSELNAGLSATASTNNAPGTPNASITASLAKTMGYSISYALSYTAGQQIGPYMVPAGNTGEATYGFRTIKMSGTQQACKPNGTWGPAFAWSSKAPVKNEVVVKMYATPDGAIGGVGDTNPSDNAGFPAPTEQFQASTELPTVDPSKGDPSLDLKPYLTVSALKSPGFAGAVALRVKNVGSTNYYGEFPTVSFLVKVHRASGPEGVDRLITPGQFKGSTVEDLGFDKATSTRTFRVTVSNLIKPGDTMLIANFNFGDGYIGTANDKDKRLKNWIEVSQLGRLSGDVSVTNDRNLDSRVANPADAKDWVTTTDLGNRNAGLF